MPRPAGVVSAIVGLLAIVGMASAAPRDAELGQLRVEGPVSLVAGKAGTAVLEGDRLVPGDDVTGLVTLSNAGDRPGALKDTPGVNGGRLSSVLRVRVDDLTSGGAPIATSLTRRTPIDLGTLPGRTSRTYRVTATFPDTGVPAGPLTGDNLQQGARVEVAMNWQVAATDLPSPTPPAPPAPGAAPPSAAPAPGRPPGRPALVTLRVPAQRVIKPRRLNVFAECEVRCRLRFSAKIDNAPKARAGRKAKRRRTLMARRVIKREKRWVTLKRAGREKRFALKLTKRALKRLKRQLRKQGRAGITVTARMRSSAGHRTVRRRIVMRTYKKGETRRPSTLK